MAPVLQPANGVLLVPLTPQPTDALEAHGGEIPVEKLEAMSEAEVKHVADAMEAEAQKEAQAVEQERKAVEAMDEGPEKEVAMAKLCEDEKQATMHAEEARGGQEEMV